MANNPVLVWFFRDLRLSDQPALTAAMESGRPVIPVYIHEPNEDDFGERAEASQVWLHHSLQALEKDLRARGARLIFRRGPTLRTLRALIEETGAEAVYWCRRYEPKLIARDQEIKKELSEAGLEAKSFNGLLLYEPWDVKKKSDGPFQVFTPFWKAVQSLTPPPKPRPTPEKIPAPKNWPVSDTLESLKLLPEIRWDENLLTSWTPGEAGASRNFKRFLGEVSQYRTRRDYPAESGTSRLSPHLHFGEISVRRIYHEVSETMHRVSGSIGGAETFLKEVGWREFAYHLLYHFPRVVDRPLRQEFENFAWLQNTTALIAWQKGLTGYPIVDAGMRELWATGFMHNRVRMIAASFLVKDLLISWREGAAWFENTLVDADLANNTLGWQWVAGCGADAAPFFRIFNPTTQGEKFDPDGTYIRRWIPEIAKLPKDWIHSPSKAPQEILKKSGVVLGQTYPLPIVDHAAARVRALDVYKRR